MKKILMAFFVFLVALNIQAQDQTQLKKDSIISDDLLQDATAQYKKDSVKLLPDKYIFTQKILWGPKGLMRNFNTFKLSNEERERELKIRRVMLISHQILGFVTLGGMIGQGIVGSLLYNSHLRDPDNDKYLPAHLFLAHFVNTCYFTTAGLALLAPPKMINERKGYGSIKLHKALAIVHFTSMVAVNVLSWELEAHPALVPYHRAAAITAFSSFALGMIVLKF